MKMLKKIYWFLLIDHSTGFMRVCLLMMIPCALSEVFCHVWMVLLALLCAVVMVHPPTGGTDIPATPANGGNRSTVCAATGTVPMLPIL